MEENNTNSIYDRILNGDLTFLKFVESLESKLINPNVSEREEALKQLTNVLLLLPENVLSEIEVSTLVRFFSVRLADSVLLTSSCIKSLNFLSHCKNFSNDSVLTILSSLFKEHMVQALTQTDRFLIFSLIKYFLDNKIEMLKKMDTEFVLGFIFAADGEKDPRNLMLIFKCFQKIAQEFSMGPLAENMFQLMACYFPVNFKPPNNDPYSFTSEQLSEALHICLTSNRDFAQFCYQLIKDELDENKAEDRASVLTLLAKSLNSFPPNVTSEFANRFWQEIRKICVTLTKSQSDVERLALECLKNLITTMIKCGTSDGRNSSLTSLLDQISKDCEHFLTNVEMQLYDIGNKMLTTVAATDANVCSRLASKVLVLLMERYQTNVQDSVKLDYLNFLCDWICLIGSFRKSGDVLIAMKSSLIALLQDRILISTNQDVVLTIGLKICVKLVDIDDGYFADGQLASVFHQCVLFVEKCSIDEPLWKQSVSFLQVLALKRLDFVTEQLGSEIITGLNCLEIIYTVLTIVSKETVRQFLPDLLRLTTVLDENLFRWLNVFAKEIVNDGKVELLNLMFKPLCHKLLDCASLCVEDISKSTGNYTELYGKLSKFGEVLQDVFVLLPQDSELEMFEIFIDKLKSANTCVTPWILCCEKLIVAFSENNIQNATWFMESAIRYVMEFDSNKDSMHLPFAQAWSRCLSALLNKLLQSSVSFNILTDQYVGHLEESLFSNDLIIDSFSLATNALLIRNFSPLCTSCLSKLINLLNSDISDKVAKSLEFILIENPRLLSVKTKAKRTFLYKQRIFVQFVQILTETFKLSNKSEWKKNYFRIMSILLENTPKEIQTSNEFEKLIPLLMNSVDCDSMEILLPSVNSILHLLTMQSAVDSLRMHLPSLIQRLCKLAQTKGHMELQRTCLQCLSKIVLLANPVLLNPWRQQILRSLAVCLDDPKRLVRREAVICRNKWLLLT